MSMKNALYLIDGHSLVFRAYYAFIRRPLITSRGENTSALFGFMRMLLKLIADEKPEYLVCVFDARGKTFRHERYPDYKAKRIKAPEDLHLQAEWIKDSLTKLGITQVECRGYEADDVIGTLADQASRRGIPTVVLSGDKDILQLVNEKITIYANKKGISEIAVMDRETVIEEWGVPPERVVDLLSLTGDQSDNVPGVKGIGSATAVKLVSEFGSIESIYDNLERVSPERVRTLLEKGRESALLSKELITLHLDAPVDFDIDRFRIDRFPLDEGIQLLAGKELSSVVADLRALRGGEPEEGGPSAGRGGGGSGRGDYSAIRGEEDLHALLDRMETEQRCAVDTESTGRDPMTARIIGVSVSFEEGKGYYVPLQAGEGRALGSGFIEVLKPFLEDGSVPKVGQNIKYDYVLLRRYGVDLRPIAGDSMIAAYLLDPGQRIGMDDLARKYLDYETIHYEDVVKDKKNTLLDYPLEEVTAYAGEDADVSLRLVHRLEEELEKNGLTGLYREIEIPLLPVLGRMESTGIRIDAAYMGRMSETFAREIEEIEGDVHAIAEEDFNVRSTKQLGRILFEKLGLPVVKRTKTGYSTDESVLEELAKEHKIARFLLRYRKLTKLKSTYVDSLPSLVNPETGRIHTSFNQTIAATGRLSSANPNLQNIPIREEEGRAIRRAFIPEEGWRFVSADYSQIELRILASLSSDKALGEAFRQGRDVHRETASLLFGTPPEDVSDQQRSVAKTINYSIIYGISPFGLAGRLGVSRGEAARFISTYFARYDGVRSFFDGIIEEAKRRGYVETLLGRRRYIPEIRSDNKTVFDAARRIAINTPVQGTAADLIKKAMVMVDAALAARGMESRMLLQVHDELVFESPPREVEGLKSLVKEIMEGAISFQVPLLVNLSEGSNWEEAH
jgi:DNA polymerase-1